MLCLVVAGSSIVGLVVALVMSGNGGNGSGVSSKVNIGNDSRTGALTMTPGFPPPQWRCIVLCYTFLLLWLCPGTDSAVLSDQTLAGQ